MRSITVVFDDDDFEALKEAKGDRTWREAIKEDVGDLDG